jgi:hypothetical protein
MKPYQDGLDDLEHGPRTGRPPAFRNEDTDANVREKVTQNRRRALRMIIERQ